MRRLGIIIALSTVFVGNFCTPALSSLYEFVPATTLQIAKDTGGTNFISEPKSKIVRVGIGSQNFSTYEWNNVQIYSDGVFELYNKDIYIDVYGAEDVINVSTVGKIFVLKDKDDNVIAKVSGPIIFKAKTGLFGITNLKRAGKNALYRGDIELISCPKSGFFNIVNSIELEEYLKGVVPNEMPVRFGLEALKAQSVAARNYVLSPRIKSNPNYDVVDSVASQVYFGANTEQSLSNKAIEQTRGIVATYNWDLILAQYSSTAGGYTESYSNAFSEPYTKQFPANPKPYLTARPDYEEFGNLNTDEKASEFYKTKIKSFDVNSPYFRWEREWTKDEFQTEIQNHIAAQSSAGFVHPTVKPGEVIGNITGIKVLQRGTSGKIMKLEIQTENGNYIAEKELVIRRLLTCNGKALPSANIVFEQEFDEDGKLLKIKAYGGGFGHGVGLSQYGAGYMATELNKSYDEILKHYYTNITLSTMPFILSSNTEQNTITQSFYTKSKSARLVIDNKYKVGYLDAKINGNDVNLILDTGERINKIDLFPYLSYGTNTITFYYPADAGSNKGLRMYIELTGENGNK